MTTTEAPERESSALQQESRLLLACLTPKISGEGVQRLKSLAGSPIHWDFFLALAERHWVVPLVYLNLREWAADVVPGKVISYLAARHHANVQNSLSLAAHTVRIIEALEGQGIDVIAYKGPVLGERAYGDLCLRQFCDIDLFLRRNDVPKARALLNSMGFDPEYRLAPEEEPLYLACESEYTFHHPATGVSVELHWRVAPRQTCRGLDDSRFWATRVPTLLLNKPVYTFATAENLLVLAIHNGGKHHWERLEWIVDMALLAEDPAAVDWGDLIAMASRAGMRRTLFLGLSLARDLLGAEFPRQVSDQMDRDRALGPLEREVIGRLFAPVPGMPGKLRHTLFSLKAREGFLGKLAYCAAQAGTSSPEDRRLLRLPEALSPLYGIIRLVRWLRP